MIHHNRLQNKISESVVTLPLCAVVATAMWWLPQQAFSLDCILGWLLCALTTYIVMETNNVQHLIRLRTRMMSCVWLMLAAGLAFMHPLSRPCISAACLAVSYMLLFQCYQHRQPVVLVYHSFLFLGLGGICAPVLLPMALLFYFYLAVFMRALTFRAFWAGLLGLLTPYWCWLAWCVVMDDVDTYVSYLTSMLQVETPDWQNFLQLPFNWLLSCGYMSLLFLTGILHYLFNAYDDKIRVRMMLYVYVIQTILLQVLVVLQPSDYQTYMALLLVSGSPLIAHYFALTGSWFSNTLFVLYIIMYAAMAYLNLWMPSFSI